MGGVAQGEPGQGRGREESESRSAFVLRCTLTHPHVHTLIAGTKNPAHLREKVEAAVRGPLSPDTYAEAKRRLDEAGLRPAEASGQD